VDRRVSLRASDKGLTERADEMFSAQLKAAGVETKLVRVREAELDPGDLPKIVARELARCDCGRRLSVQLTHDGMEFNAVPECNVLAGIRVVAVEGHAVPRDYLGALEALVTRDGSRPLMVRVADKKTPVPIKCRPDAPPPPFKRLLR
jgi:hypothetical protein